MTALSLTRGLRLSTQALIMLPIAFTGTLALLLFIYLSNTILSVNLGGLFVLEPFISPALFQKYPGAVDEWDLSVAMAADTAGGGLNQLEDHYSTFIVRAYLNPIGHEDLTP